MAIASSKLERIVEQTSTLTPDEQLQLAAILVENARAQYPATTPPVPWRDVRGMAKPSLLGEDAQAWVSRTRTRGTRRASAPCGADHDDSAPV